MKVGNTDQGLANYDLWAKSRPTFVFVNRFLLHHLFCESLRVFFLDTILVLSTSERDSVACKAKAIIGL